MGGHSGDAVPQSKQAMEGGAQRAEETGRRSKGSQSSWLKKSQETILCYSQYGSGITDA